MADQDRVEYTIAVSKDEAESKRLICTVRVGEREIVESGDGFTRMEVETRAADEACKILKKEGRRLGKGKGWRVELKRGDEVEEEVGEEEVEDEDEDLEENEDEDQEDGRVGLPNHVVHGNVQIGLKGRKRRIDDDDDGKHDHSNANTGGSANNDDNASDEDFMSAEE